MKKLWKGAAVGLLVIGATAVFATSQPNYSKVVQGASAHCNPGSVGICANIPYGGTACFAIEKGIIGDCGSTSADPPPPSKPPVEHLAD